MGSQPLSLSRDDLWKIGQGFLVALAGFVLAYVSGTIIPQMDQTNTSGMLAVALFSVVVNVLRKFVTDTTATTTFQNP
jgi:hypothetical protein